MKSFIQYLNEIKSVSNLPIEKPVENPGMMSQIGSSAMSTLPLVAMMVLPQILGKGKVTGKVVPVGAAAAAAPSKGP